MSNIAAGDFSLCWDCQNATDFFKCEWAAEGTPVPGWWAIPTTIKAPRGCAPTQSYHVVRCPKFKRGSVAGGQAECLLCGSKRIQIDQKDMQNIAEAIIETAINDWRALGFGKKAVAFRYNYVIEREEVLEFFFSNRFEALLGTFSQRLPSQIRKYLFITEDMNPKLERGGSA